MAVPIRRLGKNGPNVPALGFGLAGLSGVYGTAPTDEERFKVLDYAKELGNTFWDSSDSYGDNEQLLGKWFKRTGKRDEIFLASKFGIFMENGKHEKARVITTGEYCKKACDASLKRLGIESIDLYYPHRLNPETPIEVTMRAMAELREEGKIKHIGLSEVSSDSLRRACKIAPVAVVQVEYSPFSLDIEGATGTHILKTCRELGVGVVCYSPLGRGLLTGAFSTKESISGQNDIRGTQFPRFSDENIEANARLVSQFKALADKRACTTSQLALAWLLKQGTDIIPIPGTKRVDTLKENWSALSINLTDEEEAAIRRFVDSAQVQGYRSSVAGKGFAFGNTREEL